MLERHQIIMNQANDIIFEWDILKDGFVFSNNWMKKFGYEPLTTRVRECFLEQSHVHPDGPASVYRRDGFHPGGDPLYRNYDPD